MKRLWGALQQIDLLFFAVTEEIKPCGRTIRRYLVRYEPISWIGARRIGYFYAVAFM